MLTEDSLRDPYGTDIQLDSDGNIIILESNDVSLISGVANVLQAVDLRLSTQLGSMLRQTAFGLMAQPGVAGTAQALSYIRMSLGDALIKDPRISRVENAQVDITGDTIHAKVDIILVGREQSLPIDVIVG